MRSAPPRIIHATCELEQPLDRFIKIPFRGAWREPAWQPRSGTSGDQARPLGARNVGAGSSDLRKNERPAAEAGLTNATYREPERPTLSPTGMPPPYPGRLRFEPRRMWRARGGPACAGRELAALNHGACGVCVEHARAGPGGKQRQQAAALHSGAPRRQCGIRHKRVRACGAFASQARRLLRPGR